MDKGYALTPLRVRGLPRVALHADLTMLARLSLALARARGQFLSRLRASAPSPDPRSRPGADDPGVVWRRPPLRPHSSAVGALPFCACAIQATVAPPSTASTRRARKDDSVSLIVSSSPPRNESQSGRYISRPGWPRPRRGRGALARPPDALKQPSGVAALLPAAPPVADWPVVVSAGRCSPRTAPLMCAGPPRLGGPAGFMRDVCDPPTSQLSSSL